VRAGGGGLGAKTGKLRALCANLESGWAVNMVAIRTATQMAHDSLLSLPVCRALPGAVHCFWRFDSRVPGISDPPTTVAMSNVTSHMNARCRRTPLRLVVGLGSALLMGAMLGGCYEPVFREDEARSQYDRFDAVREQRAPQYYYDEYGNRKPNIRGRLLDSDT
jgi:hypothetical protein